MSDETQEQQEPTEFEPIETADAVDEEDVPAALERKTDDGKGTGRIPKANWESFATEGVELPDAETKEEQS